MHDADPVTATVRRSLIAHSRTCGRARGMKRSPTGRILLSASGGWGTPIGRANEEPNGGPAGDKGQPSEPLTCAGRSYRAGLGIGAVTLVMALGVIKDVWALVKPSGE